MREIIKRLLNHETLSIQESRNILVDISNGKFNIEQVVSFLTIFMYRNITSEEIIGFRDALIELSVKANFNDYSTIDLCGTGGDNKNTFNISTLASFVTAGAGIHVTKHGNYSVSSICGSSNVLEYLGIKFSNHNEFLKKCLDQAKICILHAPLFHPAMKNVAPVRRNLGFKTFFNILGPLVNPCQPKNQMTGVYSLNLARLYAHIFRNTDKRFTVIYSLDGYDEVSLTDDFKLIDNENEMILNSSFFGYQKLNPSQIIGGSNIENSAKIFMDILNNNSTTAQKNVIISNSALAIKTISSLTIDECLTIARESIESKKALESFNKLLTISK